MTIQTRAYLKSKFESGDEPTQQDFIDLIDSFCHMSEPLPAVSGGAVTDISPSEWTPLTGTPTYASSTSFVMDGDLTDTFLELRRVLLTLSPGGPVVSSVLSATYAGSPDETTVTIEDAVATANLSAVAVSLVTPFQSAGSLSLRMLGPLTKATIVGLTLSNNITTPTAVIDIADGYARDLADTDDLYLTSSLSKSLSASWAVGSGNGGLLTGTRATNTLYAVWLIKRSDTGVVDVGIDPSFTAPSMPANYDKKRLIGFIVTNATGSGQIREFIQRGDSFTITGTPTSWDVDNSTVVSGTTYTATVRLPPLSLATMRIGVLNSTTTDLATSLKIAPTGSLSAFSKALESFSSVADYGLRGEISVLLDASSRFDYSVDFSTGAPAVTGLTLGCNMLSRSNP